MTEQEFLEGHCDPVAPIIREACDAYFRDRDNLLAHRAAHPNEKWVAYHGGTRLAFGTSKRELLNEGVRRGIPIGSLLVLGIDPTIRPIMDVTFS